LNAKSVSKHNEAFEEGEVSYEKELNSFADMDPKTFASTYCGYKASNETVIEPASIDEDFSVGQLSSSFDWRDSRKVTPVKNQGMFSQIK
jgi:C1A family cysteine protease